MVLSCKQSETVPFGKNFYFKSPQPTSDSELISIPNKFQVTYINSDSLYLNISDNAIFYETETKFRFHQNQIDSLKEYFDLVEGKYILKDKKEIFSYKKAGDSIEFATKNIDTIFKFLDSQKAKRTNGYLVLNQRDSIFWKVKWISLNIKILTIKQLYSDGDFRKIDSITKNQSKKIDSMSFIINPSRREFSKFFKLKHFGFDQIFRKISK